jgi:hypothetical protein
MNNLLDADIQTTCSLFGMDWADALRLMKVHSGSEDGLQVQELRYGECGYERASDWMRLANKLEKYDYTPLLRMLAGDSKKGYNHGDFTIQCTDRIYGTLLVTFKEPQLFVVGKIGDKYVPAHVTQFTGKIDWRWYNGGSDLPVSDVLDIYITDIKFIA